MTETRGVTRGATSEYTKSWAKLVAKSHGWPSGELMFNTTDTTISGCVVAADSEFAAERMKCQMCDTASLLPLATALLKVEEAIESDCAQHGRSDDEIRRRVRCLYAITDRLTDRLNAFPALLNEMYVHRARDEFVAEVQLDDMLLKPVIREIFSRICKESLDETMKILKY